MSTSPPSPEPAGSEPSKSPTGPIPRYKQLTNWMPLIVQAFGLGGFVYELLSAHPDPSKLTGAVSLALGAKVADVIIHRSYD